MTYQHSSQTKITPKKASQASTRRREVICDHDCSRRVDFENSILLPRGLTPYPFINHF